MNLPVSFVVLGLNPVFILNIDSGNFAAFGKLQNFLNQYWRKGAFLHWHNSEHHLALKLKTAARMTCIGDRDYGRWSTMIFFPLFNFEHRNFDDCTSLFVDLTSSFHVFIVVPEPTQKFDMNMFFVQKLSNSNLGKSPNKGFFPGE